MSDYLSEAKAVAAEADLLHSAAEVEAALDRMASEIKAAVGDDNPIMVCVMTGAVVPMGMLMPRLDFALEIDYIHATRYGRNTTGGELEWKVKPHKPLAGRVVVLVDDILDQGNTLEALVHYCEQQGASKVYSAVLVEKIRARDIDIKADFVGLEVVDRYLYGYGMDYKGYWRNAAGIYAAKDL